MHDRFQMMLILMNFDTSFKDNKDILHKLRYVLKILVKIFQ